MVFLIFLAIMSFLCWNCHNLGNQWSVQILQVAVNTQKPMIVFFFIDTKVGKQRIDYVRCVLGFDGFFLVDNAGRRDGLALLWRGKKFDYITWV